MSVRSKAAAGPSSVPVSALAASEVLVARRRPRSSGPRLQSSPRLESVLHLQQRPPLNGAGGGKTEGEGEGVDTPKSSKPPNAARRRPKPQSAHSRSTSWSPGFAGAQPPSDATIPVADGGSPRVSSESQLVGSGPPTYNGAVAAGRGAGRASVEVIAKPPPRRRHKRTHEEIQISKLRASRRVEAYFEVLRKKSAFSIHPDERWHTLWDLLMVALLCFVAIATPVEVAFFTSVRAVDGSSTSGVPLWYWSWNRVIDALFVMDLVMNFFLGFEDDLEGTVVRDVKVIAKRYAQSWFVVDFVSVLPFFVFDPEVGLTVPTFTSAANSGLSDESLSTLQILRIARVLKIVRLLRASRILKRWEDRFSIRSTILYPLTYVAVLIFVIHCMACVFELSSNLAINQRQTWETVYFAGESNLGDPLTKYISALYWSCMTVTTIGYGDLTPTNVVEEWICIAIMFLGSCIYAFLVGTIVSSLEGADPANNDFQRDIENLGDLTKAANNTRAQRQRLVNFFNKRGRPIYSDKYFSAVLGLCSPGIRAVFFRQLYQDSLMQLPAFKEPLGVGAADYNFFLGELALHIHAEGFPPLETIINFGQLTGGQSKMYVLRRGLVGSEGRVFNRGSVLGDDIVCLSQRRRYSARTLTFVDAMTLSSDDLHSILDTHADRLIAQRKLIRKHALRKALRNTLRVVTGRIKRVSTLAVVAGIEVDILPEDLLPAPQLVVLGVQGPSPIDGKFDPIAVVQRALFREKMEAQRSERLTENPTVELDATQLAQRLRRAARPAGADELTSVSEEEDEEEEDDDDDDDDEDAASTKPGEVGTQEDIQALRQKRLRDQEEVARRTRRRERARAKQGRRLKHRRNASASVKAAAAAVEKARDIEHRQRLTFCRRICRLDMATLTPLDALEELRDLKQAWFRASQRSPLIGVSPRSHGAGLGIDGRGPSIPLTAKRVARKQFRPDAALVLGDSSEGAWP